VTRLLVAALLACAGFRISAQERAYTDFFYRSGELRIQAYLYKPDGEGPFPAVIYNHGSRVAREHRSNPFPYIGAMLAKAGYVVLVPERRGYGKSDGTTWRAGADPSTVIPYLEKETDDVLAGVDYLRTLPYVDGKRIGIMGWSFGGIVTMLAIARTNVFLAAVNQAGGAQTWERNAGVRSALIAAADKATTPTLLMVAENDRTTASVTTLAERFKVRGVDHKLVIYEAFRPETSLSAGGHAIFGAQGQKIWRPDVLEFLGRYLRP
jgi:dienelactone hydrolase